MKRKMIALLACLLLLGACQQTDKLPEQESLEVKGELTDRQKEILALEKLPTNYEELSYRQREAIQAIEEMLTYIEDKYGKPFDYVAYYEPDMIQVETLVVCEPGLSAIDYSVEIKRVENEFQDDYPDSLARQVYKPVIEGQLLDLMGEENIKLTSLTCSMGQSADLVKNFEEIQKNPSFSAFHMVAIRASDEINNLDGLEMELTDWLEKNAIQSTTRLFLLDEDVFEGINLSNAHKADYVHQALDEREIRIGEEGTDTERE